MTGWPRRIAAAGILALAGCNAPLGSGQTAAPGYRSAEVPIGVTSRFDPARFAGLWQVRAVLPEAERFDELLFRAGSFRIAADVCDAAGICARFAEDLPTRRLGPGQFAVTMPDGAQRRIWVLWVDEGFRTALLASPDGSFAWILDRAATGGADRIAAAREILDFNGYDTSYLKEL